MATQKSLPFDPPAPAPPSHEGGAAAGALERVERKSLLYRSGLGFFCVNHVQGCSHGCLYPCYAFMMAKHYGRAKDYAEWCRPRLVGNALALLERDLRKKAFQGVKTVQLCLTTDPFMVGHPEVAAMSLRIIEVLHAHGVASSILTKGRLPIELTDLRRYGAGNTYGISLVSLDEEFRRRWEPGAAPYADRIAALRRLHDAGARTRVHMEPYPTPNLVRQDLLELLDAVSFVGEVYWSGWNYNREACDRQSAEAYYGEQARIVQEFCRKQRIECRIGSIGSARKKKPAAKAR